MSEPTVTYAGPTGAWNRIETKTDYIYKIDGAIPEWLIKSVEDQFWRVPMEWNHYSVPGGKPFFGRTFYNSRTQQNEQAPWAVYALLDAIKGHIIPAIDAEAEYIDLLRINVNGYPRTFGGARHVDYDDDVRTWSCIYYINSSDGPTRFWKSPHSHEPVFDVDATRGSFLIFPACYDHEAIAPNVTDFRMTLNYCFRMNSKLNEPAYAGDPNWKP